MAKGTRCARPNLHTAFVGVAYDTHFFLAKLYDTFLLQFLDRLDDSCRHVDYEQARCSEGQVNPGKVIDARRNVSAFSTPARNRIVAWL